MTKINETLYKSYLQSNLPILSKSITKSIKGRFVDTITIIRTILPPQGICCFSWWDELIQILPVCFMIYEFINRTEDFMQSLLHQGSSAPRSLKKFFIYSMSTLKTNRTALSFTFYQFFSLTLIGEQGMAQWWELSPPISTQPDVYAICGLSLLLVLSFAPLLLCSSKTNTFKFQFDLERRETDSYVLRG